VVSTKCFHNLFSSFFGAPARRKGSQTNFCPFIIVDIFFSFPKQKVAGWFHGDGEFTFVRTPPGRRLCGRSEPRKFVRFAHAALHRRINFAALKNPRADRRDGLLRVYACENFHRVAIFSPTNFHSLERNPDDT